MQPTLIIAKGGSVTVAVHVNSQTQRVHAQPQTTAACAGLLISRAPNEALRSHITSTDHSLVIPVLILFMASIKPAVTISTLDSFFVEILPRVIYFERAFVIR